MVAYICNPSSLKWQQIFLRKENVYNDFTYSNESLRRRTDRPLMYFQRLKQMKWSPLFPFLRKWLKWAKHYEGNEMKGETYTLHPINSDECLQNGSQFFGLYILSIQRVNCPICKARIAYKNYAVGMWYVDETLSRAKYWNILNKSYSKCSIYWWFNDIYHRREQSSFACCHPYINKEHDDIRWHHIIQVHMFVYRDKKILSYFIYICIQ